MVQGVLLSQASVQQSYFPLALEPAKRRSFRDSVTDILIGSEPFFRSSERFQHQLDNLSHFHRARGIACQETACGEP
jgi:hypothetical protein